jgi:hypothetical protein
MEEGIASFRRARMAAALGPGRGVAMAGSSYLSMRSPWVGGGYSGYTLRVLLLITMHAVHAKILRYAQDDTLVILKEQRD